MERLKKMVFSMSLTGMLLMLFAIAIGTATFIENDFGTTAAKAYIYNALWFELLLTLLAVNMVGNIFKYKMYRKEKLPVFLFHAAFLLILFGAGVTRYISYEGVMRIREGSASNEILSTDAYLQVKVHDGVNQKVFEDRTLFTTITDNYFHNQFSFKNNTASVEYVDFVPNVAESIVESPNGIPIIVLVTTGNNGRKNVFLKDKEHKSINGLHFEFNAIKSDSNSIEIKQQGDSLLLRTPVDVSYMSMLDQSSHVLASGQWHSFESRRLHNIGGVSIVLKSFYPSATTELVSAAPEKSKENSEDALIVRVSCNGASEELKLTGGQGFQGKKQFLTLGGLNFELLFGAKSYKTPFAVKLNDFQLDRYPGSNSPSSYASEITIIDPANDIEEDHRIFMNNVLQYGGFRLFQSSYDKDEKGTILSANHDFWGTYITYLGYLIMGIGMCLSFFSKKSRFAILSKKIDQVRESRKVAAGLSIFLISSLLFSNPLKAEDNTQINPLDTLGVISVDHATEFGTALVQDQSGRMKPINTLASEVLRKVTKKEKFLGRTPEQVVIGMLTHPHQWQSTKMISVKHKGLKKELGIEGKYAAFHDFFDEKFNYKLKSLAEEANNKKPAFRSTFDKDVIAVDERVNICYMVYSGELFALFPKEDDENNKWYTVSAALNAGFKEEPKLFVKNFYTLYISAIKNGMSSGEWKSANEVLGYLKTYQTRFGADVLPSQEKIDAEILYNNLHLFKKLSGFYGLVGFVLLILLFIRIINPKLKIRIPIIIGTSLLIIGFAIHIGGLALRWYISGHAPWSNGYESMIYIAFATMLAGFIFSRKSPIAIAATSILAALILWVAGLSWLDPEVTNLVPVLKSYWLTIHVSMITASYGFLALACLLGFLNLLLMIAKSKGNAKNINLTIREITYIIEMTMTIGLFMLTIGTFLGGVWANESWGRYWGWDAKETWALTTVLVYAFIIHMRFIPGMKGVYAFNFAAVIGYASVIMTYFGVNYYLSGLHSYAAGDPVPIPDFVYYTIGVITVVASIAYFKESKGKTNKKKQKPQEKVESELVV